MYFLFTWLLVANIWHDKIILGKAVVKWPFFNIYAYFIILNHLIILFDLIWVLCNIQKLNNQTYFSELWLKDSWFKDWVACEKIKYEAKCKLCPLCRFVSHVAGQRKCWKYKELFQAFSKHFPLIIAKIRNITSSLSHA